MQNIEALTSSLDAQVLEVMQSLRFSDSPLLWSTELAWIFPETYRFVTRSAKEDIRTAARFFQRTSRTARLSDYVGELYILIESMRLTLSAADFMTAVSSRVPRLNGRDIHDLREQLPFINDSMDSITARLSILKDQVAANVEVFGILEESEDTVELLLSSLSSTIPDAYVTEGEALVQRLVRMWSDRRVVVAEAGGLAAASQELHILEGRLKDQQQDQTAVLVLFKGLVEQIKEVPALRLSDREFAARDISGASSSYRRLLVRCMSLYGDVSRLEHIIDNFWGIIEAAQE